MNPVSQAVCPTGRLSRIFLLILICLGCSGGGDFLAASSPHREGKLSFEVLGALVRIENRERGGLRRGQAVIGTGFLVTESAAGGAEPRVFLITNKHVVSRSGTHLGEKVAQIFLHMNRSNSEGNFQKAEALPLRLETDEGRIWRDHPGEGVDIVAFDVTKALAGRPDVTYSGWPVEKLISSTDLAVRGIGIGSEVLILGYPFNITTNESNFPIARRGVIASRIGENLKVELPPGSGKAFDFFGFLIDATIVGNSSGSPVLVWRNSHFEIAGIIQSFLYSESWDLGRAHYGEYITEALKQFEE